MKKRLLSGLLAVACITMLSAQDGPWPNPCGTPAGKSVWLKKYQLNPEAHNRNVDTVIYVPLSIHLVGNDAGEGFFRTTKLLDALCKLNEDYAEANIYFYMEGEPEYISNSAWYNHDTVLVGAEMMFANNVEHTVNTYFVSDPAGNCGYNLPYAGIAMSKSCSDANEDTWAHEIGHNLSLPHPFLGWEGGVSYDGSVPHNFNDPAPVWVTYNYTFFKDTLILDTLIIDTALVELVEGSNCQVAADGFCGTSPDYLSGRWICNGNSESPVEQTDPSGAKFRSDGTLIMGYADDPCQARFTSDQIAAMRANLYEEKPDYLYNQTPAPAIGDGPITLNTPLDDETIQFNDAFLSWEPVENAAFYVVQVSLLPNFSSAIAQEYISIEPFLLLDNLLNNRTYYWRIRPYNSHSFCTAPSGSRTFQTADLVHVNTIEGVSAAKLFPNPTGSGQAVMLEFRSDHSFSAQLELRSAAGQLLARKTATIHTGDNHLEMDTQGMPAGLYFLWLECPQGRLVERMLVR
ncbi:MAG: hypothetical protein H6564_04715 [Lewinellaceae bacterium]|nr:hypothetical protein [Lewinellaceae bacterium]